MPKYRFKCPRCRAEEQKTVPSRIKEILCEHCSPTEVWMQRQMPKISQPNVREVVDKNTGITWADGQREMILDRKEEYFWTVEVPRLVASGTYSLETMLENGWIRVDDAGKIHVNNKPPDKR